MKKVAKKFCPLMKKRYICSVFKRIIIMAIAIKTIPVLTGEMAKRFVEMAEDSNHKVVMMKKSAFHFYGVWRDNDYRMSADEFVKEIKDSRNFRNDVEAF